MNDPRIERSGDCDFETVPPDSGLGSGLGLDLKDDQVMLGSDRVQVMSPRLDSGRKLGADRSSDRLRCGVRAMAKRQVGVPVVSGVWGELPS